MPLPAVAVPDGQDVDKAVLRSWMTVPEVNGVKFPATQVPSADVNTLDEYKEGSFTPTLSFGGASVGMTYGSQAGRYTKTGNRVDVDIEVVLTAKGSSTGNAVIGALPFAAAAGVGSIGSVLLVGVNSVGAPVASVAPGTATVLLWDFSTSTATQLTHADMNDTTAIYFSATYAVS